MTNNLALTDSDQDYEAKVDAIWETDQLERRSEAQQFINYIEGVTSMPHMREDVSSFTISVDAGYGEGKTYFLRRVADQMKLKRPVAFVDAWRDDLADEPLTALIVTLQDALGDLIENNPEISSKFEKFKSKAGAITKIAGKGLLKKGLSLLITSKAVDGIEAVIGDIPDDQEEEVGETVGKVIGDLVDKIGIKEPAELMQSRIDDFKAGRQAIDDFKISLSGLIDVLRKDDSHASIVIIIDELDRCRPTYAVKLLEEVKHLFDVKGLVFVFGINGEQLGHSLAGAYGNDFNGQAYLSRFINRQYRLKTPSKDIFIAYLIDQYDISAELLFFPTMGTSVQTQFIDVSEKIASYCEQYLVGARDIVRIIGAIRTCLDVNSGNQIYMPLLLPKLISKLIYFNNDDLVEPLNLADQIMLIYKGHDYENRENLSQNLNISDSVKTLDTYLKMERREINRMYETDIFAQIIGDFDENKSGIYSMRNYSELIETVGRFTNPANS